MRFETTVQRPVEASGIGLHSGVPVTIRILPAPPSTGIVFLRTDLDNFPVPASWRYVARVSYATSLMRQGVLISTTEHLLSVFYSMGVDNAFVEIDNLEFRFSTAAACPLSTSFGGGLEVVPAAKTFSAHSPARHGRSGGKRITILPAGPFPAHLRRLLRPSPHWPAISRSGSDARTLRAEIAPARTFGFAHELDQMRDMGLIRGAALSNAVCFDRDRAAESRRTAFPGRVLPP